jgi:carboxyl-terminal processing protease
MLIVRINVIWDKVLFRRNKLTRRGARRYPLCIMIKQYSRFPLPIKLLAGGLLITMAFSIGFFVGEARATRNMVPGGEGVVTGVGKTPSYLADDIDFKNYWDIWNFVKEKFYRQPVSDKNLYYGSLKGLLSGLDDPYSIYFDPKEASEFSASLEGSFEGIGAEIGIRDEKLQIVAPLSDSPAEQAGLLSGDLIALIDGTETIGMSVEEAVMRIRGEKGTEVILTIVREGEDLPIDIPIIRDKIVIDSVKWEIDQNNIMVIRLSTFNHDTSGLFTQAIQEALTNNVEGIILDLRSNPGGLLSTAIDIASSWVGYDTVVIERTRNDSVSFNGLIAPRLQTFNTVVLVDGGSASASEIVAGALQDYGYAKLVGTRTFGKGSVQDYRELSDGSALKITTAEWYTPNGRTINQTGIDPDIEIEYTLEAFESGIDPQFETAVSIILGTYVNEETEEESETSG